MFIQTQKDKLVNLINVSNINVIAKERRIVFNMNYSIDISGIDFRKTISDYVYWDARSDKEFNENLENLYNNKYVKNNFIQKPNNEGFVNLNEISSIKCIDGIKRVIFNLSNPITFNTGGEQKITSEFVYVNFKQEDDYNNYVLDVYSSIGVFNEKYKLQFNNSNSNSNQ